MSTAMRPLSATSTCRSTRRSSSVASSWLMRLSSAISTRAPRWRSLSVCSTPRLATTASCGVGALRSCAPADCSLAVNQNTLPRPGSLSTPTAPPISCASSRAIDRPSPVPPKRRVVEPSACSNGLKSRSCASAEMPTPVSRTAKRIVHSRAGLRQHVAAQHDAAARGELDRVAQQVDEHLRQPQRVAAQRLRQVAAVDRQRQALAARAVGDQRRRAREQRVDREVDRREHQLAGVDLGQVEDVVDDVEQVHRRVAHLGEAVGGRRRRARRAASGASGR